MLADKNPQIKKAVGVLMELSQDERAHLLYEEREKARRDEMARLMGAKEEGLREGEKKAQAKFVRNMLKTGLDLDTIANVTNLSHLEIEKLK